MRVTIQPAGRANLAPSLILAALLLFPGTPGVGSLVGRTSAGKVEFICRIGSTAIWLQESSWTVYLYKTGGKLVRRAVTKSGESVKFKTSIQAFTWSVSRGPGSANDVSLLISPSQTR